MGVYDVQYIKHSTDGLPENDFVSTLHFEDNQLAGDLTTALDIAGYVAACHFDAIGGGTKLETFIGPQVSRVLLPTIKVYDGENPGSPLAVAVQLAMAASGAGGFNLPSEVALCMSFRGDYGLALEEAADDADADSAPERPRSRRRGRIFEGPFGTDAIAVGTPGRPHANLIAALVDYGDRLADIGTQGFAFGLDLRWVVKSGAYVGAAVTTHDVSSVWVDNEWDTQRRRGIRATARTTIAVP